MTQAKYEIGQAGGRPRTRGPVGRWDPGPACHAHTFSSWANLIALAWPELLFWEAPDNFTEPK